MCAVDDCDPWNVCRTKTRKARKEHACTECGRTIACGESYTYVTGTTDDSGWQQFRTCRHCSAAGEWLVVVCSGYPLTMLLEELDEHRGEFSSDVLDWLAALVRSKWDGGSDPVPDAEEIRADARRCLGALV